MQTFMTSGAALPAAALRTPAGTTWSFEDAKALAAAWRGGCELCEDEEQQNVGRHGQAGSSSSSSDRGHGGSMITWTCSRGHSWTCAAEVVVLQRFWCPYMVCLRNHPLSKKQSSSPTPAETQPEMGPVSSQPQGASEESPPIDRLLAMARECRCKPLVALPEAGACDPFVRRAWRCAAAGHEFQQSLAEGARVPGWCPACFEHRNELLWRLSVIASSQFGQCLKLLRDETQLYWHHDDTTELHLICARKHAFRATIAVLEQDGWCPVCAKEEEERARAEAERQRQQQQQAEETLRREQLNRQRQQQGSPPRFPPRISAAPGPVPVAHRRRKRLSQAEAAAEQQRLFAEARRRYAARVRGSSPACTPFSSAPPLQASICSRCPSPGNRTHHGASQPAVCLLGPG